MPRGSATSDFIDRDLDGRQSHYPTRPADRDKAEQELTLNIKKATSADETAPKQKHVRKCIVYTWDYHTSQSIWTGLRVQPILSDDVQTFKALITVHKILQEGHPVVLKEGQNQTGWLETCGRTTGIDTGKGYGSLIRAYVTLLLAKLRFHRNHPEFNGLFEYEEYVSLKGIDDPNEGYETISDLMTLQDQIDGFQKLIFAHFRGSTNNECRISALTPQVKESYGIYRFITSMLRAMHRRTGETGHAALEPLRSRYNSQHHALRRFYYECSNLKYLTGLINIPKLQQEPPNLIDFAPSELPDVPMRSNKSATPAPPPTGPSTPSSAEVAEQARMLKEFEDKKAEQMRLEAEREEERRRLAEEQARQQREFEEMQRQQAERERKAQEDLLAQQYHNQAMGRAAELERELLAMRGQYERDQMMLAQYDQRVKALETELTALSANIQAQNASKDDMIKSLESQVALWRNKYEALAKLYSQLRTEHLDLLNKFKQTNLKAQSAQEAIDKMERMERDQKAKNLELADMIRERDRSRFETDRLKSNHREELERLRRDLRYAEERAEDATRDKSSEVSTMLSKYNRQLNELEDTLREKQRQIDELLSKSDDHQQEIERVRQEKDQELEIMQLGMDDTIRKLNDIQLNQGESDQALTAQIDTLILDQNKSLNAIIDSILQSCVAKVDESMYELESSLRSGNPTATPEYTLSMVEKTVTTLNEFATTFNLFLSRDKGGEHVEVIKTANSFSQALADVLLSSKGVATLLGGNEGDEASDKLVQKAKSPGDAAIHLLTGLQSYRLENVPPKDRSLIVVSKAGETRQSLQSLSAALEQLMPKQKSMLANAQGEIGDLVEQEMSAAARAIEEATERLQSLMARPKDSSRFSAIEIQVHDAILEASLVITSAIGRLIKAATDSQQEIVAQGKGSSSAQAFYKKNNRWTEGLISAAKAVAFATTVLIETADGVIGGSKSLEQLIVASNEVAAATAQLVQASRVKANFMSQTQERLEKAAKAVTDACKALVKQVREISARQAQAREENVNYSDLSSHEFKMREMEQQVQIVTLEKDLTLARRQLAEMRRQAYHSDETAV